MAAAMEEAAATTAKVDHEAPTDAAQNPTTIDDDSKDEDDPITASYNVYINPALPLGRRLLVLQHPNRTDDAPRPPPSELRIKSRAGMVEVDVPVDNSVAYDREKGLRWGKALHASTEAKSGGSHGLAGGFGFGAVQQRGPGRGKKAAAADTLEEEGDMMDWNEAVRQDKVLRTQTLGGQYPETKEVQYMVGVFQGKDLHLTPVSSLVHLRPQLHHLDATTYLERQSKDSGSGAGAGGGGGAGSSAAPRAIHMTIKTTSDGEVVHTETIADRLRSVQSEPWRTLRYTDENEEAAWDIYNESLFLRPEGGSGGGGGTGEDAEQQHKDLEGLVPGFGTQWGDQELLEAVSGIKQSELHADAIVGGGASKETSAAAAAAAAAAKEKQKQSQPPPEEQDKKPRLTRPRGGGTAPARRGGKARGSSS